MYATLRSKVFFLKALVPRHGIGWWLLSFLCSGDCSGDLESAPDIPYEFFVLEIVLKI